MKRSSEDGALTPIAMPSSTSAGSMYTCIPVSDCTPCPSDHLAYPYCRPYNNRQAIECRESLHAPAISGWSACGKFIGAEVREYGHFVFWNAFLVLGALSVYVWRQVYQTRQFHSMLYQRVHGRGRGRGRDRDHNSSRDPDR